MSFWMIGILLSLLPATAFSSDGLTFNGVRTEGPAYSDLPLTILIDVTNNSTDNYYGWWSVSDKSDWENFQTVDIRAGETKEVTFVTIIAQTGDVALSVYEIANDQPLYTFTIHLEKAQTKLSGSVHLNLQETPDGHLCMFSDFKNISISGTATITNEEQFDMYERSPTAIGYQESYFKAVLTPQIGDKPYSTALFGLPNVIKSGETVNATLNINFEGTPEKEQEYVVQILYMDQVIASSEPFTFIRSTNSYWTADGSHRSLSVAEADASTLIVPKEALAVDLRGIYDDDVIYKIDVSEANPNCLYYLGFLDYVPKGFQSENNIIRNGEATTVVIDSNHDYYCPIPFKTKTALFTYTPVSESMGPASPVMSQKLSGLITLPFTVQKAWLAGTNETNEDMYPGTPFYNDDFKMAVLSSYEDKSFVFKYWPELVPNSIDCYLIYDIKPSPVVFYAEDIEIPQFLSISMQVGGYNIHRRWTSTIAKNYTYSWNCDKGGICRNEEGALIRPFHVSIDKWDTDKAAFDTSLEEIPIMIIVTSPTPVGIESLRQTPDDKAIYSLYGQRVGTATYSDGRLNANGLKPGLYLVGGKKVVIK